MRSALVALVILVSIAGPALGQNRVKNPYSEALREYGGNPYSKNLNPPKDPPPSSYSSRMSTAEKKAVQGYYGASDYAPPKPPSVRAYTPAVPRAPYGRPPSNPYGGYNCGSGPKC